MCACFFPIIYPCILWLSQILSSTVIYFGQLSFAGNAFEDHVGTEACDGWDPGFCRFALLGFKATIADVGRGMEKLPRFTCIEQKPFFESFRSPLRFLQCGDVTKSDPETDSPQLRSHVAGLNLEPALLCWLGLRGQQLGACQCFLQLTLTLLHGVCHGTAMRTGAFLLSDMLGLVRAASPSCEEVKDPRPTAWSVTT